MGAEAYKVLFLCTGNTARSILAESIINRLGAGRFQGFSAGSHPQGRVNPFALDLLQSRGFPTDGLRSKDWAEFAADGAPEIDFVFTVCDNAAGEVCPIWPGHPMTAHWGVPDPAAVDGGDADKRQAFEEAFGRLSRRIQAFIDLPIASLDAATLKDRLRRIGQGETETA